MQELLARAEERGYRPFILGAKREVLDQAVAVLQERHPKLVFAGTRDGYFSAEEEADVCAEIRASGADMLFVAMGTPRKELFLAQHSADLGVPLLVGVGGAVDVIAGITRRAPLAWQKLGLEWLYRLLQEPRRMLKRYAVTNARFAVILAGALARRMFGRRRVEAAT
jgi:N-acetylglucosaminyldiphosphoundecaprenol N-acetyl-beta-D-mannosaminyltransferase